MSMFDDFPYLNTHELNLDWILRTVNRLDRIAVRTISEDAISTTSGTWTPLESIVLPAGYHWLVSAKVAFASNPTGLRAFLLNRSANPEDPAAFISRANANAIAGDDTTVELTTLISTGKEDITLHRHVYQVSGEYLALTSSISLIGIPSV